MTADALRDRIAAAWSDHETGALRPEGYVLCSCGQRFTSPQALARHRASVILEVLADADPTDLGYEQVGIIRENDHIIRWDGGCRTSRVIERPVYARPRPRETADG